MECYLYLHYGAGTVHKFSTPYYSTCNSPYRVTRRSPFACFFQKTSRLSTVPPSALPHNHHHNQPPPPVLLPWVGTYLGSVPMLSHASASPGAIRFLCLNVRPRSQRSAGVSAACTASEGPSRTSKGYGGKVVARAQAEYALKNKGPLVVF